MWPGTLRLPARGINQYTVPVKGDELRAAEAHIARLEEELLHLKDVKRDLQLLREEHRRLRRSAEGRVAKILSAPFRLFRRRQSTEAVEQDEYGRWFAQHRVSAEEAAKLREQSRMFSYRPLISILTPTFNADERFLMDAVESVIAQAYENWELILIDDGSSDTRVRGLLENLGQRDARIQTGFQDHGGISSALNTALARARGGWIALLDHDDLLEPDALFRAIELLQNDREADVIYSDEDKIVDGKLSAPMPKPDWSPEFFCTHDYLGHFVIIRRDLAQAGFRSEFDGAQDYDLPCAYRKKRTGSGISRECFIIGGERPNRPRTTSGVNRARWKRDGPALKSTWRGVRKMRG